MQRSRGEHAHGLFLECKSVHVIRQRTKGKVMSEKVRGGQIMKATRSLEFILRTMWSLRRAFSIKGLKL